MKKQKIFTFMLFVGMALLPLAAPAKSALGMVESLEEKARSGGRMRGFSGRRRNRAGKNN